MSPGADLVGTVTIHDNRIVHGVPYYNPALQPFSSPEMISFFFFSNDYLEIKKLFFIGKKINNYSTFDR
jgi:hypothetical protein